MREFAGQLQAFLESMRAKAGVWRFSQDFLFAQGHREEDGHHRWPTLSAMEEEPMQEGPHWNGPNEIPLQQPPIPIWITNPEVRTRPRL